MPSDEIIFGKGNFWGGGYYSSEAQTLIGEVEHRPGLAAFDTLENYYSTQMVGLWLPTPAYEVIVVKNSLAGWRPMPLPDLRLQPVAPDQVMSLA